MNVPVADLKYAKDPTLLIVDAVYSRFDGNVAQVPGITHLADIHASTAKKMAMMANADAKMQALVNAVVPDHALYGALDRDDATGTGFVAFRGTKTILDWINDFDFAPAPFLDVSSKPLVHLGFLTVYSLLRDDLMNQLRQSPFGSSVNRVVVTGHSLGAGIATLCALDLAAQGTLPNIECCTFASPRVFFVTASTFNKAVPKSLRVANPVDIVTHLPSIVGGYVHVHGGFDIAAKIQDFHSLDLTYAPGLQAKIDQATQPMVAAQEAEIVSPNLESGGLAAVATAMSATAVDAIETPPAQAQELTLDYEMGAAKMRITMSAR